MDYVDLIPDIAENLRAQIGGHALIELEPADTTDAINVRPLTEGPCPFVIHAEDEDEITIEFGQFSILHIISRKRADVIDTTRWAMTQIISGAVIETIWSRQGVPCKAKAVIGDGQDAITVRTRTGLCLRTDQHEIRKYQPYAT